MKKTETISLTTQLSFELTVAAVFLLFIGGAIFDFAVGGTGEIATNLVLAPVVYVSTIIAHELLHGFGFLIGGAKPSFGVGIVGIIPFAYATSYQKLPLKAMLITAYLPFIVLSIVFVYLGVVFPQYQDLLLVGFLANFSGAVGDLWIAAKLWKYLRYKDVMVQDTKSGTEVYSSNKNAHTLGKKSQSRSRKPSSWGKTISVSIGIVLAIQLFVPMILIITGFTGNFQLGLDSLYLFKVDASSNAAGAQLNLLAGVVAGTISGVFFSLISQHLPKRTNLS
ncbi:DUF3267 domain-containing protein [Candidatus Saccharibacteria bacterium]|nr:DUF3267 domain-containing protein [Candidatus Saccharibacteria bacterium]NCU40919.1 DUF3267 domain-containing protein [Candidatus Saccharibacteria bacterium]